MTVSECLFIKIDESIEYPVGANIGYNIKIINLMFERLYYFFKNNLVFYCSGSSGSIISSIISAKYLEILHHDKPDISISYIRKDDEFRHSPLVEVRPEPHMKVCIIDDFISTGCTYNRIIKTLDDYFIDPNILCVTGYVSIQHLKQIPSIIFGKQLHSTHKYSKKQGLYQITYRPDSKLHDFNFVEELNDFEIKKRIDNMDFSKS